MVKCLILSCIFGTVQPSVAQDTPGKGETKQSGGPRSIADIAVESFTVTVYGNLHDPEIRVPGNAVLRRAQGAAAGKDSSLALAIIVAAKYERFCHRFPRPILLAVYGPGEPLDDVDRRCAPHATLKWQLPRDWTTVKLTPSVGTVGSLLRSSGEEAAMVSCYVCRRLPGYGQVKDAIGALKDAGVISDVDSCEDLFDLGRDEFYRRAG